MLSLRLLPIARPKYKPLVIIAISTYAYVSYYKLLYRLNIVTDKRYSSIDRRHPPQMPIQHCSTTAPATPTSRVSPATLHPHFFTARRAQATAVDVRPNRYTESYILAASMKSGWLGHLDDHNPNPDHSHTRTRRLPT
jgi:hypothetical protein